MTHIRVAAGVLTCVASMASMASMAQSSSPTRSQVGEPSAPPTPTITTRSTLVLVPALVHDKSGQMIFNLKAEDFALTDNGVPQTLRLEKDAGAEPLALVVCIQGGDRAVRELELGKFSGIASMLDAVAGGVPHRIAVVGFDSSPVIVTDFTSDTDEAEHAVKALIADDSGDGGAAILDAVGFSLDLLRKQPPEYRRAILLISETNGTKSKLKLDDAVRAISDSNTAIYAAAFSSGKSDAGNVWSGVKSAPPTGGLSFMPEIQMAEMGLMAAIEGLRKNIPETVAHVTGGEYYQFINGKGLDRDLLAISNHIPNRYVLSFQPRSPRPGYHVLKLSVPNYAGVQVSGRTGYWAEPASNAATPQH